MKFKNIGTGKIIETNDIDRINRLKGYPDMFQVIEEVKTETKKEELKETKKTK